MMNSKIIKSLTKEARTFTKSVIRKPTKADQAIILSAMLRGATIALRPEVTLDLESLMKDLDPGEMRVL